MRIGETRHDWFQRHRSQPGIPFLERFYDRLKNRPHRELDMVAQRAKAEAAFEELKAREVDDANDLV